MCSRYRYHAEIAELPREFQELCETGITPRFNVAPTQQAPVVLLKDGRASLQAMRWGLVPSWSKDGKGGLINARSETAADKPAFRDAFRQRPCLVIAHGFYEWQTVPHGKQPWHFHRKGDKLMCFAGLWEEANGVGRSEMVDGKSKTESEKPDLPSATSHLRTFTILTTSANSLIERIHDRMPVILPENEWRTWIDGGSTSDQLQRLLVPYDPAAMESWPVTPQMNHSRFESEECVKPFAVDDLELKFE